jgi:hypothetical protein
LVESKNTANTLKVKLEKEDAKKYKNEISLSKKIIKKVDGLIALYLGTIDKRQGITRNPEVTVNQRLGVAGRYIRSRFGEQTDTEKTLMNQFKDAYHKTVFETNAFFGEDWSAYEASLEKIKISPFKEIKNFTIN